MNLKPQDLIKKNPFILAPMDDVTDIAFREIAQDQGASYSTTELTSVDALIRDKVSFARYQKGNLKVNSVQLFGSKPEVFVQAAKKVEDEADFIDVNFGCPSACVNANDAGAILLKDPKNVGLIIEKLVKNTNKPVTAKIRLGYKKTTYDQVAKEIEDAGAQVLAVHGRTAEQKYSGTANWDAIKEIYENINIPLIGNGDIREVEDIDKYYKTHCDALMIGRAAIGNPAIFSDFNSYLKTKQKPNLNEDKIKQRQKELFLQYLEKLNSYEVFNKNRRIQRQAMWFFKGINGVKELRLKISQEKDINKILQAVKDF